MVEVRVARGVQTVFATAAEWDEARRWLDGRYRDSIPDRLARGVTLDDAIRRERDLRASAVELHRTRRHRDKGPRGTERLIAAAASSDRTPPR